METIPDPRFPDLHVLSRVRIAIGTREGVVVDYERGAGRPWRVLWDGYTDKHPPKVDWHLGGELVAVPRPYQCWLCHDSGWLCDGHGGPRTVAILSGGTVERRDLPPSDWDVREARREGLNPRRCHACAKGDS